MLSQGHPAIEEVLLSCLGMITLWVPCTVLISLVSDFADEIMFCKYHSVHFCRVNSCIKLEQVLNSTDKNSKVLLLMAAVVEHQDDGTVCGHFNWSRLLRCRKISGSIQHFTTLVSTLSEHLDA